MARYLIALKTELCLMDIVLEMDDFDPNTAGEVALQHWLDNKDRRIIEGVDRVEVVHYRCLDDQPHFDPFEGKDSENWLQAVDQAVSRRIDFQTGTLKRTACEIGNYIDTEEHDPSNEWVPIFRDLLDQVVRSLGEKPITEARESPQGEPEEPKDNNVKAMEEYELKVTESKETAVEALREAGILDEMGQPAEPYRGLLDQAKETLQKEEPDDVDDWV